MKMKILGVGLVLLLTTALTAYPLQEWEGDVVLIKNAKFRVIAKSGREYKINHATALGALNEASKIAGFSYTVDDSWYEQYGSLLVDSIWGMKNEGMKGWQYWVNYPDEPLPWVGADRYEVKENDTVDWFYGDFSSNPNKCEALIRIHVHLEIDEVAPNVEIKKPGGGLYIFDRQVISFPGFAIVLGKITVEVNANDLQCEIEKVEFYINSNLMHIDEKEPYEWLFEGGRGKYNLKAIAYDMAGNIASDEIILFKV
ncbi:MAG: Ig-like domain-containing protein [Candidatus Thermoplasmatota archaeon]